MFLRAPGLASGAHALEVEEHLVGRQALGLLQEPRVAAGDGEIGTSGSELGDGVPLGGQVEVSYRRVATAPCRRPRRPDVINTSNVGRPPFDS